MLPTLYPARRLAASFTLSVIFFSAWTSIPASQAAVLPSVVESENNIPTSSVVLLERNKTTLQDASLLAHHEASVVGTNQLLTSKVSTTAASTVHSLWGNMILNMAIQNDPQIQQLAKKMGGMNGYVLGSVGLISGLSLAQSIDGLATLQQDPHPIHPPIIGLAGAGLSVLSVGTEAVIEHHYKKALKARQDELVSKVASVLGLLKTEGITDNVQKELATLIGSEATEEFSGLWQATHPHPQ